MKCSSKNYLVGILLVTVAAFFLFGCAAKTKTTQPEGTAEQPKPSSEPAAKSQETTTPASSPAQTTTAPAPASPPAKTPEVSQPPAQRTTRIALPFVNFRQGPSMDSKIIKVLKKGTKLMVLEEKGGWLRVQLEDGTEGWVGKSMTTEGTPPKSP